MNSLFLQQLCCLKLRIVKILLYLRGGEIIRLETARESIHNLSVRRLVVNIVNVNDVGLIYLDNIAAVNYRSLVLRTFKIRFLIIRTCRCCVPDIAIAGLCRWVLN